MDWKSSYNTGLEFEHKIDNNALEMFKKMLANNRNSPLIHYYGSTLTSNDVDFQSDVLATAIQEETKKRNIILNKGDRIALYMQNTPEYLISMLSIWKLGCTGVNINPMYKNSELSHIIKDSTPKVIISLGDIYKENIIPLNFDIYTIICFPTDYLHESALTKYKVVFGADNYDNFDIQEGEKVSYFQSLLSRYRKYKHFENDSFHELHPEDTAFLTYTSGTTAGLGKGAMNTHRNVCFSTRNLQQWVRLSPNDTVLGVAPLFHITGLILNLSAPLSIGCPIVLTYRFSPTVVAHLIERYKCTMTCGSITLFSALMNDKNANLFNISSLTKAFSGGAPISPSIVNNFYKQFSIMITPIYGLTESTAPSHSTPLYATAPVDEKFGALSIGIPMYEIDSKIVDENGVEVAHGDVGEIIIKGPNIIPGYWNLPEKTKETFDKNGYLKTGDVGFRDQRGFFFLVDRKKDLIISSGYKIWPREVEDIIMQIDGVLECAVVGIPDEYRGETVKAFLSCKEGFNITPQKVIDYCKSKMAAYKYPRFVEIVKEVPKNLSGKILRRSLRPPSKSNL